MDSSLLLLAFVLCFAAYALKHIISSLRSLQRDREFAKANGCEDVVPLSASGPLGIFTVVQVFKVAKQGHLLKLFDQWLRDVPQTFEQRVLMYRGVNTTDPLNIEAVLSTQFSDFSLGYRRRTFFPLLGDGIFSQDGAAWKRSRALLRPQFQRKRSKIFDEIRIQAQALADCIPSDRPVDLQPLFFRFTLDTTWFMLFGRSMKAVQKGDDDRTEGDFSSAFQISQDFLVQRDRLGPWYWMIDGKKFRDNCAVVHSFIDQAVEDALRDYDNGDVSHSPEEMPFVSALIEETRDRRFLRDQLVNVLLAGRDTTACLLSWTFRLLATHPPVLEKLVHEISATVGIQESAGPLDRDDLKKMPYLNNVLKEVLRLYPSVPVNGRLVERTTTLPRGGGPSGTAPVLVRAGEAVGYLPYVMHRRWDLYGPDADIFRPERWEPDAEWDLSDIGWGYLPFNGGPRICLGQEFALLEAAFVVVRLLQVFPQVHEPAGTKMEPVGEEPQLLTLVLAPKGGCNVVMSR